MGMYVGRLHTRVTSFSLKIGNPALLLGSSLADMFAYRLFSF